MSDQSLGITGRRMLRIPLAGNRWLLRPCRHRPPGSCAAEQRDELAPSQLIELHAVPRKHLVEPIADFDHRAISAILMRAARA
jgi:hypothetical protein